MNNAAWLCKSICRHFTKWGSLQGWPWKQEHWRGRLDPPHQPLVEVSMTVWGWPLTGKSPHRDFLKGGLISSHTCWLRTMTLQFKCWYQKSTDLLLCKCPFSCLVHKITQRWRVYGLCFPAHSMVALQEATEYYMANLLKDNVCYTYQECNNNIQRYLVGRPILGEATLLAFLPYIKICTLPSVVIKFGFHFNHANCRCINDISFNK